jgi:metal-sulfur cluster biosynthetic enzyme
MLFERSSSSAPTPTAAPAEGPAHRREARAAAVWEALGYVIDPEIGLDIVTLGLVYGVEVAGSTVRVRFTLTTRACPLGDVITAGIEGVAAGLPGVEHVETDLVWEPAWHPGMISEGSR